MGFSRWVHVQVEEIKAATDRAVLCVIDGEEYWLPRSQIEDGDKCEAGDQDLTLSLTEWIAKEKGLEEEE